MDVLEHPNQDRYPGQNIYVVEILGYVHLVPFVTQADGLRFLKTIIASRKATRDYSREGIVNRRMDVEEQDILDRFERGELRASPHAADEIAVAREAARNTFNKSKRVNLRMTERDFMLAHSRAREEGVPYQTLLSSVIHKYLVWKIDGEGIAGMVALEREGEEY